MTFWGLLGLGKIADTRIAPAFAKSASEHLKTVAGRDPARTAAFAARHGAAPGTVESVLADPEIEAVYIAAANDLHAPWTLLAAAAGKHVLCEKPLARDLDEAESMVNACHTASVHLGTAFMMRHHPLHQAARAAVAAGTLGTPLQARAQFCFGLKPERQTWRLDRAASGGGPLMDVGSHALDLICFITGARVREVGAFAARQHLPGSTEDAAVVNLVFADGMLGQVNVAFNTPFTPTRLEVHGTAGSLVLGGTLGQVAEGQGELITAAGTQPLTYTSDDLYQGQLEAFGRAVRDAATERATGEDGLENLRTLLAAYRSSYWGGAATLTDEQADE